jgi:hypothetical protein
LSKPLVGKVLSGESFEVVVANMVDPASGTNWEPLQIDGAHPQIIAAAIAALPIFKGMKASVLYFKA